MFYYLMLCQAQDDPVWGMHVIDWVTLPPIRVWRNRLGKAEWFWMSGKKISPEEVVRLRQSYPLTRYWGRAPNV